VACWAGFYACLRGFVSQSEDGAGFRGLCRVAVARRRASIGAPRGIDLFGRTTDNSPRSRPAGCVLRVEYASRLNSFRRPFVRTPASETMDDQHGNATVTTPRFDFDSTAVRRAFDCLSKVIKVTVT